MNTLNGSVTLRQNKGNTILNSVRLEIKKYTEGIYLR